MKCILKNSCDGQRSKATGRAVTSAWLLHGKRGTYDIGLGLVTPLVAVGSRGTS